MSARPRASRPAATRGFGVADGLILVAATAVGLASTRIMVPELTPGALWKELSTPPRNGWSVGHFVETSYVFGSFVAVPCLAAWTLAWLLLRWRGPRTPRRRLVREPGAVACLAAAVSIVLPVGMVKIAWAMFGQGSSFDMRWLLNGVALASSQAAAAVFWCWVTMALGGRWRPLPTWLDRSGRLLGAAWIASAAAYGIFFVFVLLQ